MAAASPFAGAAPTAVNDSYSTAEDSPLSVAGVVVTGTGFETEPFAQQWDYLNNLPNTAGTGYPADGSGYPWNSTAFDKTTSTVGPWRQTPLPAIGPVLDYFAANPGVPVFPVLTGGTGVTTYLFRNEWVLSPEMAATAQWTLRYLIDDGAIVYINGIEAFRVNMADGQYTPAGAVTPLTATNLGGNESAYTSTTVDLSGKIQAGVNSIAVELHQITGGVNTDAGLDFTLAPVSPAGFTYVPNGLATAASNFNSGSADTNTGFNNSGGLHIRVGERTPSSAPALPMSGVWSRNVDVPASGTYLVSFKYRGTVTPNYDNGEFIEGVFRVDSTRYGSIPASGSLSGSGISLYRFTGNGNSLSNGEVVDTGWQTFSQPIILTAGSHLLMFGLTTALPAARLRFRKLRTFTSTTFPSVSRAARESPASSSMTPAATPARL